MVRKILLYCAVYFGCLPEGETSLINSAFAAHRGYLEIFTVMFTALVATQSRDWIWFFTGRMRAGAFLRTDRD